MQRKQFIKLTGATSAFTMSGGAAWLLQSCNGQNKNDMPANDIKIIESDFTGALPSPPLMDLAAGEFAATASSAEILKGKKTEVYGYYEGILGKTIVLNKGDKLNLNFKNNLPQPTNVHWHGLIAPPDMDGFPDFLIQPNNSFRYEFTVDQRAGTYWYHPHPHYLTAQQVVKGLAGFFIVTDEEEKALNLPSGENETAFVIQDKRFDAQGNFIYSPTDEELMTGYFADHIIVNGAYNPYKKLNAAWNRMRIINGSTARVYNLAFSNGQEYHVIGSDAGLMAVPETVKNILLSPGERIDLLVDFTSSENKEIFLRSETFTGGGAQGGQTFNIMKFKIGVKSSQPFTLPQKLSSVIKIDPSTATKTRTFDISNAGVEKKMKQENNKSGEMKNRKMNMHTINGQSFEEKTISETVNAGATEIWEFDNSKGDEIHPMHIHGVHFQLLERTGGRNKLTAIEKGWKDTVMLMPGEKLRTIMTFPVFKGKRVVHCHNLEHEESGMMLGFETV